MIPVNKPLFISNEKKYLARCIETGWISSEGPFVKQFEQDFSSYIGKRYGIAVTSGTAALEIAIGALRIKAGDEVIMPTFTIISCASAVVAYGGTPVFVDSESETWNMDVRKIEEKITKKTKAIMPVHIYGHPCDMDPIIRLAKKYNLKIIEDAAEAHGAIYKGKKCGSFGDISCFSFYANKIISTGEGGMLLTNSSAYAKRARLLRDLGFDQERRFHHKELARNYRMSNVQAALGVAQTKKIDELIALKREHATRYTDALKKIKGLTLPTQKTWAKSVYWMYGVVLDERTKLDARLFAKKLEKRGIGTRPFFYPLHLQPILKDRGAKPKRTFPIAERIARQGLYLPSGLGLTNKEIDTVCKEVKTILS